MTTWRKPHETGQQRGRRYKADPYRASVLAPKVEIEPVKCDRCERTRAVCLRQGCTKEEGHG